MRSEQTMTKHLTPEEFVDAIDGAATAAAESHLRECEMCREQLDNARETASVVRSVDVPEPSPLFWEHFSARVAEATEALPVARPWWNPGWRPLTALAAAAGVLILAFVLAPKDRSPNAGLEVATTDLPALGPMTDDDGSWSLVLGLAAEVDPNDLRQAATPVPGTADAMIDELTAEQRAALARLLQEEMGDS
jgi:hypothetical protein